MSSDVASTVSYVLTTYNSKRVVADLLRSLAFQDYPASLCEIVVADGGSTDGTVEICRAYGARVVSNPARTEKGFSGGKTVGIRAAQNEMVIILDSDNVLSSRDYTRRITAPLASDPTVVAVSPIISANPNWSSFERFAGYVYDSFDFEYNLSCEERTLRQVGRHPKYVVLECGPREKVYLGNGTAVRRSAALAAGGYDFDLEAGKRLFSLGKMILSTYNVLFHHNAFNPRHYVRKKIRGARDFITLLPSREGNIGASTLVVPSSRSSFLRMTAHILANLTVIYPLYVSVKKSREYGDSALMWHALMAPLVTAAYFTVFLTSSDGKRILRSLLSIEGRENPIAPVTKDRRQN